MRASLSLFFLGFSLGTNAGRFGDKTYEQCVADATSFSTPIFVGRSIMTACRGDTFPERVNECLIDSLPSVSVEYAATAIIAACNGQSFPKQVNECLIDSLPDVTVKYAALVIVSACQGNMWAKSVNKCILRSVSKARGTQEAQEAQEQCLGSN